MPLGLCSPNRKAPKPLWHHVALVFDGNRTASLYVDGRLDVYLDRTYNTAPNETGWLSLSPGGIFPGTMDEFMISDRALTADEIRNLHDAQK